jgi:threonine dehydrogenase-like Zn-dependent dehydrogenase
MGTLMKALVYTAPQVLEYSDQPMPKPGQGESLIQVLAAGICGSDMHAWHGHDARRVPPLILGHEVAGVVLEGRLKGKTVTMNPLIVCGECDYCRAGKDNLCRNRTMIGMTRPGGFAQYITIPDHCLVAADEGVPVARVAVTEPTAVCVHAVNLAARLPNIRPLAEQNVLIIGAGSVGVLTALILRQRGVGEITVCETNAVRARSAASATGAIVIDPVATPPGEKAYHCIFDAVGSTATRTLSTASVMDAGTIVHVGLQEASGPFDARRITLGEITFAGVYTYTMREFEHALELLSGDDLGDFAWIHEHALADGSRCFHLIDDGTTEAGKIVLRPFP